MTILPLLKSGGDSDFCGGAEIQQYHIAKALAERGYPVSFVTLEAGQGRVDRMGPFRVFGAYGSRQGLPVVRFLHPRMTGVVRALGDADAEIYYLRGASQLLAPIVWHARRKGRKVLFAGASDTNFDPEAKHFRFRRDHWLYWWGVRRVDGVVAQNETQAGRVRDLLGMEARIIHNALPDPPGDVTTAETVLWVGNIRPKKRPELFLDLAAEFPDTSFTLVGGCATGLDPASGYLADFRHRLEALPQLDWTGYLPPATLEGHYGRAKVLVNTSAVEGYPNTFLHAWARGVPVLTYVDPDGVVARKRLGWVVASPEEMRNTLDRVLRGEIEIPPERIHEYYRTHCMTERQTDAYEVVLAHVGAG